MLLTIRIRVASTADGSAHNEALPRDWGGCCGQPRISTPIEEFARGGSPHGARGYCISSFSYRERSCGTSSAALARSAWRRTWKRAATDPA